METWYPKSFIRHKIGKQAKNMASQHGILCNEIYTANKAMWHNALACITQRELYTENNICKMYLLFAR
jgi:hypothetical protein